jgi:WD40 repeat protein
VSPDGKTLVARSHSNDGYGQWDVETAKLRDTLKGNGLAAVYAADGKTLATAGKGEVRLWESASGKELLSRKYGGHLSSVQSLSFFADGKTLLSASYGEMLIWDIATTRERPLVLGAGESPALVQLCADGKLIVTQTGTNVRLLDSASGKETRALDLPTQFGARIALSPDGTQLAWAEYVFGQEGLIHVWDVATGKELRKLPASSVSCMTFSRDGKLLAAGIGKAAGNQRWSNQIGIWDLTTGKELGLLGDAQENTHIATIAFLPDGRNILSQQGTTVRLWELATSKRRREIAGQRIACSPNGRFLATLSGTFFDPVLGIWDLRAGRERQQFKSQRGLRCVAFAPDGQSVAAGGDETTILLWDVRNCTRPLPAQDLDAKAVEALWSDLASDDGQKAYQAVGTLASAPKPALALLREKLRPIEATNASIRQLVADLDSPRFEVRKKAMEELEKLRDKAEPALRDALLNDKPSLEVARRLEQLLEKLEGQGLSPQMAQVVRAVEVLELLDSADSRQFLEVLAGGEKQARQTREAKAALQRLGAK